jgi:RNA polymerase sigma-70 factor (ECF subfamily)
LNLKRNIRDGRHRLWWRLARRGHEDALRLLYGELYGPVAGYVGPRVNNRQDAEDLVSQIFQRFLENLARYQPRRGSVMSWVLAMARHAVIDHHRRLNAHGAARSRTVDVAELADVLAAATGAEDPLATMVRDEEQEQVRRWLYRQPADTREMFALRYGHDLRLKEVARVMDLSEAAVKQRFARTLRQIRHELLTEPHVTPKRKEGPECLIAD